MKDRRTATVFVHSNWEVVTKPCMQTTVEARGAFYYGRDSGNFGRKSNGKVRFGSFWPQHSGPRLKVVYFGRSDRSVPFHFDKQLHCPTYRYLPSKSHSSWLARCDRKMSSIFLRFSYWSLTGRCGIIKSTLNLLSEKLWGVWAGNSRVLALTLSLSKGQFTCYASN